MALRGSAVIALLLAAAPLLAQEEAAPAATTMTFEEYEPKSTLVVPEHPRTKAKYPFIDVHNHQRRDMSAADVDKLVADMDRIGLSVMVNLSGGSGDSLKQGWRRSKESTRSASSPSPTSTSARSTSRTSPRTRRSSSSRT